MRAATRRDPGSVASRSPIQCAQRVLEAARPHRITSVLDQEATSAAKVFKSDDPFGTLRYVCFGADGGGDGIEAERNRTSLTDCVSCHGRPCMGPRSRLTRRLLGGETTVSPRWKLRGYIDDPAHRYLYQCPEPRCGRGRGFVNEPPKPVKCTDGKRHPGGGVRLMRLAATR